MHSYEPPTIHNSHHTLLYPVGSCVVVATLLSAQAYNTYSRRWSRRMSAILLQIFVTVLVMQESASQESKFFPFLYFLSRHDN